MRLRALHSALLVAAYAVAAGCVSTTGYRNEAGRQTSYDPVDAPSRVPGGVGIESNDIVAMTDRMMRDLLAQPTFGAATPPPRVIVDSQYFVNEGSTPLNKNLITDRLRVELGRAAGGRMLFVGRENVAAVEHERELRRQGVVDGRVASGGTAGADYRLTGRIGSLDKVDPGSGARSRYTQITFEMLDLQKGYIVWSGLYEFQKSGADDVVYQ